MDKKIIYQDKVNELMNSLEGLISINHSQANSLIQKVRADLVDAIEMYEVALGGTNDLVMDAWKLVLKASERK